MAERFFPCQSDDLIVAALRRARARRLAIHVTGRQRAALRTRLAQARLRRRPLLIGPFPTFRATIRRAARRAELTPTSQRVLSAN